MGNNFKHLQLVGNITNLIILKYLDMIFTEMKKGLILFLGKLQGR